MWRLHYSVRPVSARFPCSSATRASRSASQHQRQLSTLKSNSPSLSAAKSNPSFTQNNRNPLLRPFLFTGAVCFGSFGAVEIWKHEQHLQRCKASYWYSKGESFLLDEQWRLPPMLRENLSSGIVMWMEDTVNFDGRVKTVGPIIAVNAVVLCAFSLVAMTKSPLASGLLRRFFVHETGSGRAIPLLLSCFAHSNPIHLGVNMCCLWSFGNFLVELFGGREQFWASYVSAGTVSSLGAICIDLTMKGLRGFPMTAGMGASGALYGVIVAYGQVNPDARVYLIFAPWWEFSAAQLNRGLITFDLVGLMLGWRLVGHAAHLGGAAAGICVVEFGGFEMIRKWQRFVAAGYEELRERFGGNSY